MPRTSPPRKDKNRVPRQKRELPAAPPKEAERIAKVVARAGLGSRREIEEWIEAGRVAVNGEVLASPAVTVTAQDKITIDGEPLPERERTRLFIYHKPRGVVTTNRDPEGRTTLFEILPKGLPRLVSIGRLDLNSEGLLLLTNDGGLARVLELPETAWLRRYRVRANGEIDQAQLDTLLKGITVEGVEYGPIEATLDRVQGANAWITVSLREGKNREIRNVLGALGLQVNRLIRVSYGPFQLGEIPEGGVEEVRTRVLRDQIGADLAAAAGADFAGPLVEREVEEAPVRPAYRPAGRKQAMAEKSGGLKAAARRSSREPQAFDAPVEDFIHPAGPRPRRRASEERGTERVGTVADRKGRTVKVERVLAPKGEAPARGAGPKGRAGSRATGRPGAEEASARPFRRSREDGPAERPRRSEGRPPFRDDAPRGRAPREEKEDFRRRPTRSGEREERPRRYDDEGSFKRSGPRREGERPQGERAFRPRPEGRGGDFGDKPPRGRSFGGDRPEGDRPSRARPRPEGRGGDFGDRPPRGRSFGGDRPEGDRPSRARPRPEGRGGDFGDRPPRGRSFGGDRPEGDRPSRARPRPEGRGGDFSDRPPRSRSFGGDRPEG
ncbi:pseudouridine synthase, partial [Xanthobacter autotrophicus DSM 431]|uniref:pseudouridine synthase n=1 Tax=Xanthobacter nonsaccharivorans TaxID=3119912 RepID=UPI00372620D6